MPTSSEVGWVDVYETVDFDGDRVTVLRQLIFGDSGFEKSGKHGDGCGVKTRTATIVLRGATTNNLNDLESTIDDVMNLIKSLLRDRRLVPGAGATELELARRVDVYGGRMKGWQQHVVKRFATALEVIPRTLAENAAVGEREGNKSCRGKDEATEPSDGDIEAKSPSDDMILADSNSLPYPIHDSLAVKCTAIQLAMEAAVSVLTIDNKDKSGWIGIPRRLTINFYWSTLDIGIVIATLMSLLFLTILAMTGYKVHDVVSFFSSYFSK
jgi:T-complex protein 1 subunit theta